MKEEVEVSPLSLRYKGKRSDSIEQFITTTKVENSVKYVRLPKKARDKGYIPKAREWRLIPCRISQIVEALRKYLDYEITLEDDPSKPLLDRKILILAPLEGEDKDETD